MCGFTYVPKETFSQCACNENYNYKYIHMIQSPYRNTIYDKMNEIKI